MTTLEKLELIHCAIQEVIKLSLPSGLDEEMDNALKLVEDLREPYLERIDITKWKDRKPTTKKDKLVQSILRGEIIE